MLRVVFIVWVEDCSFRGSISLIGDSAGQWLGWVTLQGTLLEALY